jgi:RNA polymerase sigma-70 factor (ECF subfamily)
LKVLEHEVDEQVLVAAAQRDPSRFGDLYESNFGRVYAYIARRVANRHDAEDLTAEVFHEALRNLRRYEWRGLPFAAWLLGIAAHLLADRWRHVARRQTVFDDWGSEDGRNGDAASRTAPDPASVGPRITDAKIEESAMLSQLVDELPADQRLVVLRRFVEQKNVREIADELRRSEGAVKQLQFRALQNLRLRMRSRHVESIPD